jgi:hypothetical protein
MILVVVLVADRAFSPEAQHPLPTQKFPIQPPIVGVPIAHIVPQMSAGPIEVDIGCPAHLVMNPLDKLPLPAHPPQGLKANPKQFGGIPGG